MHNIAKCTNCLLFFVRPQSLVLSIAFNLLDAEAKQHVTDKESHMSESCPALDLPGSVQELQVGMQSNHYI